MLLPLGTTALLNSLLHIVVGAMTRILLVQVLFLEAPLLSA